MLEWDGQEALPAESSPASGARLLPVARRAALGEQATGQRPARPAFWCFPARLRADPIGRESRSLHPPSLGPRAQRSTRTGHCLRSIRRMPLVACSHEVRTTVAGWRGEALRASHRTAASTPRLLVLSRPAKGGPRLGVSSEVSVRPQPGGRQVSASYRWLARPERLATPPATVVRPKRAKHFSDFF
jgi:hypothetical protein